MLYFCNIKLLNISETYSLVTHSRLHLDFIEIINKWSDKSSEIWFNNIEYNQKSKMYSLSELNN